MATSFLVFFTAGLSQYLGDFHTKHLVFWERQGMQIHPSHLAQRHFFWGLNFVLWSHRCS